MNKNILMALVGFFLVFSMLSSGVVAHDNPPTGSWNTATNDYARGVDVVNGVAYVADGGAGLTAVDTSTGNVLWNTATNGYARGVDVVNGVAYVADHGAGLTAVDTSTENVLWNTATNDYARGVDVVDGVAYVTDGNAGLTALTWNSPPSLDSKSVTPDPPLIEENVSYSLDASDSDGTVENVSIKVYDDGSEVYSDYDNTVSSSTVNKTWSDVYEATEGGLDAKFVVTDDAGATDSGWLNRTLTDDAPTVTLNKPENQTYFDYDVPLNVTVTGDDGYPQEDFSCTVEKDSTEVDSFYLKEGTNSTYTSTVRSKKGSHNVNVSCDDNSGNTGSDSENYEVKRYEFQEQDAKNQVYETASEDYDLTIYFGDMVNKVNATLYWNGTQRNTVSENVTELGNKTVTTWVEMPIVETNESTEQWYWNYSIDYDTSGGTSSTDTSLTTTEVNQTVLWGYYIEGYNIGEGDNLEGDNVKAETNISDYGKGDTDVSTYFNGTTKQDTTPEDQTVKEFTAPKISSLNKDFDSYSNLTVNWDGRSFVRQSNIDTLTVHQMKLTDCSGSYPTSYNFTLIDEENKNTTLSGDLEIRFDVKNNDLERSWPFDFSGSDSYQVCMYPSWGEYRTSGMAQYWSDPDYPDRNYYLVNATVDNSTNDIPMYLLEDSLASRVDITIEDSNGNPMKNVVVRIERYYIGKDKYLTVGMSKSDSYGEALSFLRINEIYYKFTLYKDGELLEKFEPMIITSGEVTLQVGGKDLTTAYDYKEGISYNCEYDDKSEYLACEIEDSTGMANEVCLIGKTTGVATGEPYNKTCGQSTTMTLMLNMSEAIHNNQTINWDLYAYDNNEKYWLTSDVISFGAGTVYGLTGVLTSLILLCVLAGVGYWNPAVGIGLSAMSVAVSWALGLLSISWGPVAALFVTAGILMYKVKT